MTACKIGRPRRPVPQDWHDEARALHAEGHSVRQIARILGRSRNTVGGVINPEFAERLRERNRKYHNARRASDPEWAERRRQIARDWRDRKRAEPPKLHRGVTLPKAPWELRP